MKNIQKIYKDKKEILKLMRIIRLNIKQYCLKNKFNLLKNKI